MPEETKRSFLKNVYDFMRSVITGEKYVDVDYGPGMKRSKKHVKERRKYEKILDIPEK